MAAATPPERPTSRWNEGASSRSCRTLPGGYFEIVDPPANYPSYGDGYYAVFLLDPDRLKLEGIYFQEKVDRRRNAG